jgi:exoribonuclease R
MTFRYFAEHTDTGTIEIYHDGIVNNRALIGDTIYHDGHVVTGIKSRFPHSIVAVLDITNLRIYGTNKKGMRYYHAKPLSGKYPEFKVATTYKGSDPVYVIVKFVEWSSDMETPQGLIESILGPITDPVAQELALLHKHGLYHKKYKHIEHLPDSGSSDRPVYKNAIAVDPVGCQDRDDAYHFDDDYYYIHIVDMTSYLVHDTPIDLLVRARATSVYGDKTYHMLPEQLVKQVSLSGDGPFYVMTMRLDKDFNFIDLRPSTVLHVDPQSYDDAIYYKSHEFIERIMIKYNECVAKLMGDNLLLRVQERPKETTKYPEEYRFLLENSAKYSVQDTGHSALGLERYTHATSPMRRYADILVQRILCGITVDIAGLIDNLNNKCAAVKRFYRDLETIRLWRVLQQSEDLEAVPLNLEGNKLVFYIPKYKRLYYYRCNATELHDGFIIDGQGREVVLQKFIKCDVTIRSHYLPTNKILLLFIHALQQKHQ